MRSSVCLFSGSVALFLSACGGAPEKEPSDEDLMTELTELIGEPEVDPNAWRIESDEKYCQLEIPGYMTAQTGLNPAAILQFGYIEKKQFDQFECYAIVMGENKDTIESYNKSGVEYDVTSYRQEVLKSFGSGLVQYEMLSAEPEIVQVNGMDCIKSEMNGILVTGASIYYQMAVFEGQNAFFQVLCWCIESQKAKFKGDMARIIDSFIESDPAADTNE